MKAYIIAVCISTSMQGLPLTVQEIVQAPTYSVIKRTVEAGGGVYTDQVGESISRTLHSILQGTLSIPQDASAVATSLPPSAYKALESLLTKVPLGSTSKALAKIQRFLPSLTYAALLQGALKAWQEVHSSIASQKAQVKAEDSMIRTDKELQIAQQLATDIVITLQLLLYSPAVSPCERMYALYLLNSVQLLGSQGLALRRSIERTNRFYFTSEGILRSYDPSRDNSHHPKRTKALVKFLRTVCATEQQYRQYLQLGIRYGISALKPYVIQSWRGRESTFSWRYAAGLFKALSTIDVIGIRTVPPAKIFSHSANVDFLRLMILSTTDTSSEEISTILANHTTSSLASAMKRYVSEVQVHPPAHSCPL